jgi:PBP1b-binding outer membrane lipoprotein LpoB
MRVFAVLAAALLLSGCTWVRHELDFAPAPPAATPSPKPKPDVKPPHASHVDRPVTPVAAAPAPATTATPVAVAPVDYSARCHAMADNRADDAKQLGASTADQGKVQSDTYRDCMAQSVK